MKRLAMMLVLAGCAGATTPGPRDFAILPPGAFGAGDNQAAAAALAQNAFGDAGRTYGRPAEAARAAAALEYEAGAFSVNPRWAVLSGDTRDQLVEARAELRRTVGFRAEAGSQAVLDALLAAARALDADDAAGAAARLDRAGVLSVPGAQAVDRLGNLPYLRVANLATQHAADEVFANDTDYRHF